MGKSTSFLNSIPIWTAPVEAASFLEAILLTLGTWGALTLGVLGVLGLPAAGAAPSAATMTGTASSLAITFSTRA